MEMVDFYSPFTVLLVNFYRLFPFIPVAHVVGTFCCDIAPCWRCWGEWSCPKNSSTRRNAGGQLYGPKQNHYVKDFFPPHSVRLTMVIGSLHLRLLRMGKTKETIRISTIRLFCCVLSENLYISRVSISVLWVVTQWFNLLYLRLTCWPIRRNHHNQIAGTTAIGVALRRQMVGRCRSIGGNNGPLCLFSESRPSVLHWLLILLLSF